MTEKIKSVSLFAGAGGIDLGFKWAGIDTIAAVEITDYACSTLKRNFPDTKVIGPPDYSGDVRMITGEDIRKLTGYYGEIDIVTGGPPCQPFSIASGQRWAKGDERYTRTGADNKEVGDLLPDFVRIISELKPKVFLLENVEGLLSWNDGEYVSKSLESILNEYHISKPQVLNAVDYGVPQYRKRFFLIGTRLNKAPSLPENTHDSDGFLYPLYTTVMEALEDFSEELPNHVTRKHSPETIERYSKLNFGERDKLGRVDRLHPDQPSKTIISGGNRGGGRSHLHPFLPRTLSPRECARIQTFPDDFIFEGSIARQFTQVGNAVPPLMAFNLGKYIVEELLHGKVGLNREEHNIKHPIVNRIVNNSVWIEA
ncbi:DNA cytosine methyltransferase [Shouchella rhizosphaerae]|uniref:DNA cytosine methyltransferase n=1 Tax=Shouchella rhizosphaerae TaxID=866786 RepID=UPI00204214F0|nr:DNA cytosine methyltransferase [Shouchella rhizosphaerae]MCM3382134.1 DNA cytosine methyltransferase [Shouchella rhizosphaerae]